MYQKHHNGQLSIEEFHVPFGGKLDMDNRWVIFSTLMPWEELEETYAPRFIQLVIEQPAQGLKSVSALVGSLSMGSAALGGSEANSAKTPCTPPPCTPQ